MRSCGSFFTVKFWVTVFFDFIFPVAPGPHFAPVGATVFLDFFFSVAPGPHFAPVGATVFLVFFFPVAPRPYLALSGATVFIHYKNSVYYSFPYGTTTKYQHNTKQQTAQRRTAAQHNMKRPGSGFARFLTALGESYNS